MYPNPKESYLKYQAPQVNKKLICFQERARGPKYDALIDELVDALRERYGGSLLVHWEDFASRNSYRLLARARDRVGRLTSYTVQNL